MIERMRGWCRIVVLVLCSACGWAVASDDSAAWDEAGGRIERIFGGVQAFLGDVRFDEADVQSVLALWPDFQRMEDSAPDAEEDEFVDFETLLADSQYRRWAASHGLNAEDWLRKSVRISMMIYREQMQQGAAMAPQQLQEQLAAIEQQRAQIGEEMYQQMKQSFIAAEATISRMRESILRLPAPTAAEAAALARHRDALLALMMSDDDSADDQGDDSQYGETFEGDDSE